MRKLLVVAAVAAVGLGSAAIAAKAPPPKVAKAAAEAMAVKLATDPGLLKSYRERLAANRHTTPLFDMARYARDFEDAMERIWADYCAGP